MKGNIMRSKLLQCVVIIASLLSIILGLTTTASAQETIEMVGVGDSYQANIGDDRAIMPGFVDTGSYAPGTTSVDGNSCFRSYTNVPNRVAQAIGAQLTDVTCSSAEPRHILQEAQFPNHGQGLQIDAVTASTDIVTVGMGGNPAFGNIIARIVEKWLFERIAVDESDPVYQQAYEYYAYGIKQDLIDANNEIHRRAPNATIYQIDYPPVLPVNGSDIGTCWWFASPASIAPLQKLLDRLNQSVHEAAAESGAVAVKLGEPGSAWMTSGRLDMCSSTPAAWNFRLSVPLDFTNLNSFDKILAACQFGSFHTNPFGDELTTREVLNSIYQNQYELVG
jgi:hypothetical protein